ncbi:MAG: MBL fold metallo-hydrolase [Tissierellia bacterium]|nr:MBL fold metallo-hydrolase [Tissierellia bacterium]
MQVIRLEAGIYAANCYLIYESDSMEAIIIDPGGDSDDIISRVEDLGLKVKYIILTHGHADHIAGVAELRDYFNVPVAIHKEDEPMLRDSDRNFSSTMATGEIEIDPDILLDEETKIEFGGLPIKIIHTPGHTPGGITINIENYLFTGDTLFAGSIGRTDFPGGSFEDIIASIKEKLLVYPDDTILYPGHGPASSIGKEKSSNPFIV